MNLDDFQSSIAGQIILTPRDYHAFIPHPLPTHLEFRGGDILKLIAESERTLGKLSGIGYLVPNPDFLVIPYTRMEAIASSRIEGTQASLSELFYFEADVQKPAPTDDLLEVANYLKALNYGLERLKTLPLSLRLIREVHEKLMQNVRGGTPDKTPGEFRRTQNWIGGGSALKNATYVPPPPEALLTVLDHWEKFLHMENLGLPLLIQCAMLHYQFEAIHPFLDGNGRVGRLTITLLLCDRQALPYPLLYLSHYFERFRSEYYDRLLAVSQKGDWEGWIRFFLQGVIMQGEHAIESARRIIDQREKYRQQLHMEKASASTLAMLDQVFLSPYINITQASERLMLSYPTAERAIQTLAQMGILEEVTGQKRNRVYVARQLLKLIVENEPVYSPKASP
jgi:Fic family protein